MPRPKKILKEYALVWEGEPLFIIPGFSEFSATKSGKIVKHKLHIGSKNNGLQTYQYRRPNPEVSLINDEGVKRSYRVCDIMALVFLDKTDNDIICFKDDDKTNLHLENLYLKSKIDYYKEIFWNRVNKSGKFIDEFFPNSTLYPEIINTHCWEWVGSKTYFGYGEFGMFSKFYVTHRISYMWANNKSSLSDSVLICHKCNNPSCVNPLHLRLGDHKDNAIDRVLSGNGPKPHKCNRNFLKSEINEILNLSLLKDKFGKFVYSQKEIGKRFGCSPARITYLCIKNGIKRR